jgi:phage shock protein PspC (stress-responsive transcriptional regulator)
MAVMDAFRQLDDRVLPRASSSSPLAQVLQRSRHDRHLAGVCGGLGRATGADARIWRVVFLFSVPLSFWVYVLAWVYLPTDSSE